VGLLGKRALLFDGICLKINQFSLLKLHLKLNRIRANFTIPDVFMTGNRRVEKHGNLLKAMVAPKGVFVHGNETGEGLKS